MSKVTPEIRAAWRRNLEAIVALDGSAGAGHQLPGFQVSHILRLLDDLDEAEAEVIRLRAAMTAVQEEITSGDLCFEFMNDDRVDAFLKILPVALARTASEEEAQP